MPVKTKVIVKHYNTDKLRDGEVRVGWFEGMRYDDSTPVAMVARAHEFGYGVPRRSFIRPPIHRNQANWQVQLKNAYARAVMDNTNTLDVLERFGMHVRGAIQREIWEGHFKPLAPSTIKGKGGRTKPLIDTGFMANSIAVQVEEHK